MAIGPQRVETMRISDLSWMRMASRYPCGLGLPCGVDARPTDFVRCMCDQSLGLEAISGQNDHLAWARTGRLRRVNPRFGNGHLFRGEQVSTETDGAPIPLCT